MSDFRRHLRELVLQLEAPNRGHQHTFTARDISDAHLYMMLQTSGVHSLILDYSQLITQPLHPLLTIRQLIPDLFDLLLRLPSLVSELVMLVPHVSEPLGVFLLCS